MNRLRTIAKVLLVTCLVLVLVLSPLGHHNRSLAARWGKERGGRSQPTASTRVSSNIAEVAPPTAIQTLQQDLENYQPQVTILSPKPNEVLANNIVSVKFQVRDLPIFKDADLGLGPHLHVLLDNRTYQAVYDLNQPLTFDNLDPGTHTIRAFASRPWHESFKNEGAYAQTTFHIYTKTQENSPDPTLPLLTYSRPQGTYGAEPIMLDFYLANAPLHLVAQANPKDEIADWRIRCTVNGQSFVLDRWQPIYLKGFKPGKNWVQLEFLDEKGQPVRNVFNNTARVITYEPNGKDTLSRLVRGDLAIAAARAIVDPNYVPQPPAPVVEPSPSPSLAPSPSPVVPPLPIVPAPSPSPPSSPASEAVTPTASPSPSPIVIPSTKPVRSRPEPTPLPTVATPSDIKVEASPTPLPSPSSVEITPSPSPAAATPAVPPVVASPEPIPPGSKATPSAKVSEFLNRFRSSTKPTPPASESESRDRPMPASPTLPPSSSPASAQPVEPTPATITSPIQSPRVTPTVTTSAPQAEPKPAPTVIPAVPVALPSPTPKSLVERDRRSVSPSRVTTAPSPAAAIVPNVPAPLPVPDQVVAPASPSPISVKPTPNPSLTPDQPATVEPPPATSATETPVVTRANPVESKSNAFFNYMRRNLAPPAKPPSPTIPGMPPAVTPAPSSISETRTTTDPADTVETKTVETVTPVAGGNQ